MAHLLQSLPMAPLKKLRLMGERRKTSQTWLCRAEPALGLGISPNAHTLANPNNVKICPSPAEPPLKEQMELLKSGPLSLELCIGCLSSKDKESQLLDPALTRS